MLHRGQLVTVAIIGIILGLVGLFLPTLALVFVAIVFGIYLIGIGWIAEGISDVMAAIQGSVRRRWLGWLSGALSILAGIVVFVLPAAGIATCVLIGSVLLIVVSVSTLLTIPGRPRIPSAD